MKDELFPFQKQALKKLRNFCELSIDNYSRFGIPQVISFTAPTGSGKTIIIASLFENIFFGDENHLEQPEAIFVWLSDSPELNKQSRDKIDLKADKIRLDQCILIEDESFDQEILDDGHIYFLNTQKIGKSANLGKHADGREYTIWETLQNTIDKKSNRLYFVIDEAHRGMQGKEAAKATTIMQKFLKGSPDDGLSPAPVVIGMTATPERFNNLISGINAATIPVTIEAKEVIASGLLKEKIIITYPDEINNDIAVLQAAADDWKDKWDRWTQYCYEQHEPYVNPIFIVQVLNGSGNKISDTDLDNCLRVIGERTGKTFDEGEVVHCFGDTKSTLNINGLNVHYEEPSHIADNRKIKVVFFKESLSTGWDCPRAETMMSFRHATDPTYIAQLLGRMIRTPLHRHIDVDDTLNNVHLYLPYFKEDTVKDIVKALQDEEGGTIPADIESESLGKKKYEVLTTKPTVLQPKVPGGFEQPVEKVPGVTPFDPVSGGWITSSPKEKEQSTGESAKQPPSSEQKGEMTPPGSPTNNNDITIVGGQTARVEQGISGNDGSGSTSGEPKTATTEDGSSEMIPSKPSFIDTINRPGIIKAINESGLITYDIRTVRINDYLASMFALGDLLTVSGIVPEMSESLKGRVVDMIDQYIETIKDTPKYTELVEKVKQFKMNSQIFDAFGKKVEQLLLDDIYTSTNADIERQLKKADDTLGSQGVDKGYIRSHYGEKEIEDLMIDVIIFASNKTNIDALNAFAETKYHDLRDTYRRKFDLQPEKIRKQYRDITYNGDKITPQSFRLSDTVLLEKAQKGEDYPNHLFVNPETGVAKIDLNGWEKIVIDEESKRPDFVCWYRNPERKSWSLKIPYEMDGMTKTMYPDFIIIRKDEGGYLFDILEPHSQANADNVNKAIGLAKYAKENAENTTVSRIQLIRVENGRARRLDLVKEAIQMKVVRIKTNEELTHIFETDGFFD